MTAHCSAVSVGIRSKTLRMPWIGEAMTSSDISSRPAAWISSDRVSRSRMADDGHPVDVVDRGRLRQRGQRAAAQGRVGGVAGRGEVVEVLVVAGDAHVGRGGGAQLDRGVQEGVGDPVDVGRGGAARGSVSGGGHPRNVPVRPRVRRRDCERARGRGPAAGQRGNAEARQPSGPGPTGARTSRARSAHAEHRRRRRGVRVDRPPAAASTATSGGQLLGGGAAADQAQRRRRPPRAPGAAGLGASLTAGCSRASSAAASRAWSRSARSARMT